MLVLEHNTILALDVEDMLLRHGVAHVGIASSAAEAIEHVHRHAIHLALLDLKLSGTGTHEVAVFLRERGIPFAFAIGYGERPALPPNFSGSMVIGKPYSESYLIRRLAELLSERA